MGPRLAMALLFLVGSTREPTWTAPTFLGFRLGKATLKQVPQRLRGSLQVVEDSQPGEKTLFLNSVKTAFGEAEVEMWFGARGILRSVVVFPHGAVTRARFQEVAGLSEIHRYAVADCPDEYATGYLVEAPDGEFEYLLAPARGLHASVVGDNVHPIVYALGPPDLGAGCP